MFDLGPQNVCLMVFCLKAGTETQQHDVGDLNESDTGQAGSQPA